MALSNHEPDNDSKSPEQDSDKAAFTEFHGSLLRVSSLKVSRSGSFASSGDDDITSKTENVANNQYDDSNGVDPDAEWHLQGYASSGQSSAASICSELMKDFNERRIIKQIKELKESKQYRKMMKYNEKLSTDEWIALIYYTNSESYYHKNKITYSKTLNEDKWKQLHFHATNAIEKVYKVFHYKNDKQKQPKMVFCVGAHNELNSMNSGQLSLETLTRCTPDFKTAQTYNNGNVLVLDNIYKALYSGQLKGCNVNWICNNECDDFIILPTNIENVCKLNQSELIEYGWSVGTDTAVYISNKFVPVNENNNIVDCKMIPLTNSRKSVECLIDDEKQSNSCSSDVQMVLEATNNYLFYNSDVVQEIMQFEAEYESHANPYPEYDPILVKEIMEYEYECRNCTRSQTKGGRGTSRRGNYNQSRRNRNKEHHSNKSNEKKSTDPNDNEEKDEEKDNNNGDEHKKSKPFDMCEILKKVKVLKQHKKYKIMQKRNQSLSNDELISLIYYCDSEHFCKKMKQAHRNKSQDERFKSLYFHATNGIIKIYEVFHCKNRKQTFVKQLYHGSVLEKLDPVSRDQVFFKTIMSFSSNFGVAKSFASGSMLILDDAYKALVNGNLKAADVRWISQFKEEYEYIVLPTTYHNFRKMERAEIMRNKWLIGSDHVNVYISNKYKSNDDPFCQYTDVILPEMVVSYDNYFANKARKSLKNLNIDRVEKKMDDDSEDICKVKFKKWLLRKVKLQQYLPLFKKAEYDDINMIEFFDNDELEKIGIVKKVHRKLILKKAKIFTDSQRELDSLLAENKCLKKYKDVFESNGIITMQDLENDITSIDELGKMLNVTSKKHLTNLWKIIHSSTDFDDIE